MIPNTHVWIGVNPVRIPDREIDGKRYRAAEYDHEYRGHWDPTGGYTYRRGLYDVKEQHSLSFCPFLGLLLTSKELIRWKPLRDYFLDGLEQVIHCKDSLGLCDHLHDLCEEVLGHFSNSSIQKKLETIIQPANPHDLMSTYIETTIIAPLRKIQEVIIPGRDYMITSHPRRGEG